MTKPQSFAGLSVAITTPFRNGDLDLEALRKQIDFQVEAGTHLHRARGHDRRIAHALA